jgi:hypothetical protein
MDDDTGATAADAVHELEVATEWVERAWGSLLDFHHRVGHAQLMMLKAADLLREAGQEELAGRLADDIAGLEAIPGHWTYQMVDEFREHFLAPVRGFEEEVRARLADGIRHRMEAGQKQGNLGDGVRTAPVPPDRTVR